jgi:hypothetical protein
MSDLNTATPSATPTPTPSPVTDSIGSGPNQVVFEQPAAPVETPAPVATSPDPYRVAELENGQYEVTLESGQVYKGSQSDVVRELAKAQYNATRKIAELNGKIPVQQEVQQTPQEIDATAAALADLAAKGLGFGSKDELLAQFALLPQLQENYQQQQLNNTAAQFLAQTQDFPNSPGNADKLDAYITQTGLPITVENLQMVHHYLKGTGQYERVATPAKQAANGMPMPPNGQTGDANGFDPWTAPLEELAATIRKG